MASISRRFLNTELIPRFARMVAGNILNVGIHKDWDYRIFYTTRGCTYSTLDIKPELHPDIVADITDCKLPDKTYDGIEAIGMYEMIKDWPKAINELYRILKDDGKLLVTFAGVGFFYGTTKSEEVFEKIKPFKAIEVHISYYKNGAVEYISLICRK